MDLLVFAWFFRFFTRFRIATGHSMSDPGTSYRTRDEVETVKRERDCIEGVKNRLLSQGWATEAEFKAIEKEIKKKVDGHVKFAKESPELPAEELWDDIYKNERYLIICQLCLFFYQTRSFVLIFLFQPPFRPPCGLRKIAWVNWS